MELVDLKELVNELKNHVSSKTPIDNREELLMELAELEEMIREE